MCFKQPLTCTDVLLYRGLKKHGESMTTFPAEFDIKLTFLFIH